MGTLLMLAWMQAPVTGPGGYQTVTVVPAASEIDLDARLDEPAWRDAEVIALPYEIRPRENVGSRVSTECRATFDERALYFGCEAADDPASLRAYLTDRDAIGAHDRITVFIDPFADGRRAFFFNVNPLGVQQDGIFNGTEGSADLAWDAVWESSGRTTDGGYVVEMAIPFSSLRFPTGPSSRPWRFFIERNWPRSENVVFRSTTFDSGNACNLCQADELAGLAGVEPGLGVQVNPTFTAVRTDRRAGPDVPTLEPGGIDPEIGLNASVRATEDLTLSATLNPDFSQVEADAAQLDVNEQFSLFFPEKRPFFLEGTEVFATPLRAAFTRTVASPSGGISATGKLGPVLLASLVARDSRTSLLVPGNETSTTVDLDRPGLDVLQRVRADVGASGTAGVLYTGRFADDYRNQVVGVDGFVRLTPLVRTTVQVLGSRTTDAGPARALTGRGPGAFGGHAVFAQLRRSSWGARTDWFGTVNFTARSPDFRADAGFEPQVDTRQVDADVSWNTWSDGTSWFTRINYWIGGHHSETYDGRLNSEEAWAWIYYHGPRQTVFWVWPRWGRRYFAGRIYPADYWEGSISTQPAAHVDVGVGFLAGDAIDFANGRSGRRLRLTPNVDLRVGRHVDVGLGHTFSRLDAEGGRVFDVHLSQARLVYNLSARSFLRAVLQYRHTEREPDRYVDAVDRVSQSLFAQVLFSYRIDARTGLFVGYVDNRAGREPESDPTVPLTQTDRTFFVKIGYAWNPSG